jgi:hypothetical protein
MDLEVKMKRLCVLGLLLGGLVLSGFEGGTTKTVTGWVLDSACAYTKGLTKPISRDCALDCARKGSPLVILQDDGAIFLPISDVMPAVGQNERLMPFAGKRVTVSGKAYTRAGSNAMVIEKIAEAK